MKTPFKTIPQIGWPVTFLYRKKVRNGVISEICKENDLIIYIIDHGNNSFTLLQDEFSLDPRFIFLQNELPT